MSAAKEETPTYYKTRWAVPTWTILNRGLDMCSEVGYIENWILDMHICQELF